MSARVLVAALVAVAPMAAQAQPTRVAFAASDADIANPERGFYRASPQTLDRLDPAWLAATFAEGTRLVYARIDLEPYRTGPIPAETLDALTGGFARARAAGVKLIVRATYNYPRGETAYRQAQDAALPVVEAHLRQLAPLLAVNADVTAFVQAGFIGAWGEWHTSSNGLSTPEARARVRDALLAAVPETRTVQFRYPPDLLAWTATPAPTRLRTGFHNDCFLASQTDVGTFPEDAAKREAMRARVAAITAAAPFGGETCNPADDPGAVPRTDCADIAREGAALHLTYLNADYYRRLFHDRWTEQGCMADVRRRMGYRLALVGASMPTRVARGGTIAGEVDIRNHGWARLANPRTLELLLIDRTSGRPYRLTLAANPRDWLPGERIVVPLRVVVPADTPAGTYDLALALPDGAAALREDARYAVRFANRDVAARGQRWDASLAAFRLGTEMLVQ